MAKPLPVTEVWTEAVSCLPPDRPGRSIDIEFSIQGAGGGCSELLTPGHLYVDDVTVGTHPSCPAL